MPTREQIGEALKRADTAGNVEDAKVLAKAYRDSAAPSLPSEIGRQVGLTARAGIKGLIALPEMIGNALGMESSEAVNHLLKVIGLPEPRSTIERFNQVVFQAMTGSLVPISLGTRLAEIESPIAKAVGGMLKTQPGTQMAGAATGAASGAAAASLGAGPLGQTAAALAGAMVPFAPSAPSSIASAARRALRGQSTQIPAAREAIKRFGDLAVKPTPAQSFKSGPLQMMEGYLSRSPGSHKVWRNFAERQAAALGEAAERHASELSAKSSPMMAGRAIEEGISGPGGFMEDFRDTSHMLFSKLDEYVPQDAISPVANTQHVLAKLSKPTPGAEKTSKLLVNSKILQVRGALAADIASKPPTKTIEILGPDGSPISKIEIGGTPARGGLPYFALKELRSRIGEMIGDSRLTSEIPRRQLKALYGAITDDMKATVQIYGGEDGMRAFNRANHYVKAGHERIDSVLQPVADQNLPERIFSAAASGTRQGDSTIHAVMQSLPAKQQRVVSAAVLRMMGVAPPSAQTAEGELFSVSRFLTNWAAMSPEAKRSLFSRFGSGYVENLNKIAKVAQDIRQGGEVYANPSGTAPVFFLQSTIGGAVIAMMMGHLGIAGTIVGENIFSRIVAQKILNPSFGDWLAKYATLPIAALPVALNQLSQSREQGRDGQEKKSTPSVSGDPRYRINSAPVPNPYPAIPTPGNEGVRG